VITAPSGAGKSTLIKRLMADDDQLAFSVSHTTRLPRKGEENGREYYFVSEDEFQKKIENGDFLEWAKVHNRYYGTSHAEVERLGALGKRIILDIDVQGSLALQKTIKALYLFIGVANEEVLKARLTLRGTESAEVIAERLEVAKQELVAGKAWPHTVINEDLETALSELKQIIYRV
jgi:guanylate kinase